MGLDPKLKPIFLIHSFNRQFKMEQKISFDLTFLILYEKLKLISSHFEYLKTN